MVYRFLRVWQIFLGFDQHLLQFTGPILSLHPLFLHSSCDQRCRKCVLIYWFPTNNDYSSVFIIEWTNVENILSSHKKCWCFKMTKMEQDSISAFFFKRNKIVVCEVAWNNDGAKMYTYRDFYIFSNYFPLNKRSRNFTYLLLESSGLLLQSLDLWPQFCNGGISLRDLAVECLHSSLIICYLQIHHTALLSLLKSSKTTGM